MTEYEFYKLVSRMRQAQRRYDRMHTSDELNLKNSLEQQVDQLIQTVIPDRNDEPRLF